RVGDGVDPRPLLDPWPPALTRCGLSRALGDDRGAGGRVSPRQRRLARSLAALSGGGGVSRVPGRRREWLGRRSGTRPCLVRGAWCGLLARAEREPPAHRGPARP